MAKERKKELMKCGEMADCRHYAQSLLRRPTSPLLDFPSMSWSGSEKARRPLPNGRYALGEPSSPTITGKRGLASCKASLVRRETRHSREIHHFVLSS